MVVYIDGMDFRRTGIGRVYESILAGFIEREEIRGIQTLVPRDREKEFGDSFGGQTKIDAAFTDFPPFSLGDFLRKQRLIDRFSPPADIFLYPNMNVPLFPRGKIVFTVNDIIMMTSESSWSAAKRHLFRTLTARALSRCTGLVCISEFTRSEVEMAFGKGRTPVRVIHPALDEGYLRIDPERYRKAPLVPGDYILHVGIRVAHKNHRNLILGWMEARKKFPGLRLAVAGRRLWEDDVDRLRKALGLNEELLEFTGATDEEIRNLYANAKAFVFPSFLEGFGIPPLEAMAMGVPVVCADIPVLREVNADAALYADPRSPAAIGDRIVEALCEGSGKDTLVAAGKARIRHFTRERMARGYLEFLKAMLE